MALAGGQHALRYREGLPRGGVGDPALVYDEEHNLFRFMDGRIAFSREWADWPLLRKRGRMFEELT